MNNQQPQGLTKKVVNPTDSVINLEISEADGIALANSLHIKLDSSATTKALSLVINPALLRTHNDSIYLSFDAVAPISISMYLLIDESVGKDNYTKAPLRKLTVKSNQTITISNHDKLIHFKGVSLEPIDIDVEKKKLLSSEKEKVRLS